MRRFVIPLADLERDVKPDLAPLMKYGLTFQGLVSYSFYGYSAGRLEIIESHISKDLLETCLSLRADDPYTYRRVVHTCIDRIQEIAQRLAPLMEQTLGVTPDQVTVDGFVGNDVVVSLRNDDLSHVNQFHFGVNQCPSF
jgi:hypothetical protein